MQKEKKRYRLEVNGDEKMAICNALHLAREEAHRLARREEAMGVAKGFVLGQRRYAQMVENLFFRFVNAKAEEEESREE